MSDLLPCTILMTADTGGGWTFAVEMARRLQPHGCSIALATTGLAPSPAQRCAAGSLPNLHVFQSRFRAQHPPRPWEETHRAGEWLRKLESQIRPDLIHLEGGLHGALKWAAPVIVTSHSCALSELQAVGQRPVAPEWSEYRHQVRRGLQAADLVIVPTRAALSITERNYGPIRAARVIPFGGGSPAPACGRKEPLIFSVGSMRDEGPNLRALADAAGGLRWPVFIGESKAESHAVKPAYPKRNVAYCGRLSADGLAQWMAAAAIFCLPACHEPFGFSIQEAASAGCALVLGDVPNLRELWDGAALFAPPHDPTALHGMLRSLAADNALRDALSRSARARSARFTGERMAAAYLEAYRGLLTARPSLVGG